MSRIAQTIAFFVALMMISGGTALAAHWTAGQNTNVDLCFQETEKVANGAEPETLSTLYCKRALRSRQLSREDRSATHHNHGIVQKAQGQLVAAKESFEKAVHLSKTVDQRNAALAEVALRLGDYAVAFEQYDLLAESAFVAGSEDLRAAVLRRREETLQLRNRALKASVE